jgi:anti-sigma-K factor RskA
MAAKKMKRNRHEEAAIMKMSAYLWRIIEMAMASAAARRLACAYRFTPRRASPLRAAYLFRS